MPARMAGEKVLLVHLVSNGDCLMATTVARQIKQDFPGCHLTWAIARSCKQVLANNPFVDEVWAIEHGPYEDVYGDVWRRTRAESMRRKAAGQFDHVFFTQLYPDNIDNFDGTTRSSIFRSYPGKITVPVAPVLELADAEVERVADFAKRHRLADYGNVVLFESSPASGQSFITPDKAMVISRELLVGRADTAVILSSAKAFHSDNPAVIDGSALSLRENAELSKYCTLLLGCSSGITWLLTTEWAKKLPTIQLLRPTPGWYAFASVKYDHQFWGLPHDHVLETDVESESEVVSLVSRYLQQKTFDGLPKVVLLPSVEQLYDLYRKTEGKLDAGSALRNFQERNPEISIDKLRYYTKLISSETRGEAFAVSRSAKRLGRLLRWVANEVWSTKCGR
jgi:hypothetical protein